MAQITGSSTIDWSGITLDPIDFEQKFNDFSSRLDQVVTEIENGQFFFNSPPTDTFISLTLFSGGLLTLAGSGLLSDFPVINSFDYNNPFTGDVASFAGTLDFVGNEVFNRITIGVPGLKATIIGNIVEDPLGYTSGSITQLKVTVGSTAMTIKGSLVVDADFNISGTVTQISVLSGTNSILMSGLSLPYSALDSVTTANDLFSVVGNQLAGNDTITYTNNSAVGMTFFGGAGNDTITISGPNADTLNGGDGNDILIGGLGQDTVNGDAGDDQITMLVTPGNADTIDAGADNDTIILSGIVPGDHVVVIDLSAADQIVSIGGVADALMQINFENLTASGLGSSVTVTGSDGDNSIIGSNGNDSLDGGAGNDTINGGLAADTLQGGADNDLFLLASTAEFVGGEIIDGGSGTDTLRYTGNAAATLTLTNLVTNIEQVEIANAAGLTTGLAAINVNAAAVTSNGMTLVGNNGANVLTGTGFADTLIGNAGIDMLNGGAGDDILNAGNGSDVIVIETAGDHGVGEVISGDAGADVIRFTSVTGGEELTLSAGVTVESVVIANAAGVTTGTTALDVDASAVVSNGLTLIGNAGANTLTGTGLDDVLKGGGGNDVLTGGLGNNMLIGGGGHDSFFVNSPTDVVSEGLAAGTDTVFSTITYTLGLNVENLTVTGGVNPNGTGNELNNILTGNSGNNQLSGLAGNDTLSGGAGNDTLKGGAGADNLQGGAGDDLILLGSAAQFAVGEVIDGGTEDITGDTLRFTSVVAETLTLTANVTNIEQVQIADAAGLTTGLAAINVNAAAVTSNGMTLVGNNGANVLTGTGFADTLTGNAGNDTLKGGLGNDTLIGGAGSDTLRGGGGEDTLEGGDGNDVFLFAVGDSGAGESVVGGAGTDALRFTATSGTLDLSGTVEVESVAIATAAGETTGTTAVNLNATDVTNALSIIGNNGANQITGTAFADTLTGNLGNDTLNGMAGNDTLKGGGGADNLQGGAGDDLVLLGSAAQFAVGEVIDGGTEDITGDTLRFTSVVAETLTLTANVTNIEQVQIADAAGLTTGLAAINVNAAAVTNDLTILGNDGANVLTGTSQADTLTGNGGNDTLRGGLGNDTYQVNRGDGRDTISENDSTPGNSDTLLYGATINPLDLVLSRQVNDLRIALHGTTERVTIQNWYANPTTAQVETIQAGNGQTLLNTQVDQLIQAMAQFTTDTGLSWDQGIVQQPEAVQAVLAASWQG